MRILSVSAKNFRSYEKLDWALPGLSLTLIDGENLDTGRNNMTGKTTLVDSIFWALYGFLPKWGGPKGGPVDAVIRRGATRCTVTVTLQNEGKEISITRERPSALKITVDGADLQGKSADLNDRIPDLIGMTAEQFLTAVYVSQDRKQSFFTMGEADRTQLLSQVSKVENINRAVDRAKKEKSDTELAIEKQKSFIQALETNRPIVAETVAKYTNEIAALTSEITELNADLTSAKTSAKEQFALAQIDYERNTSGETASYKKAKEYLGEALLKGQQQIEIHQAQLAQTPKVDFRFTQEIEELKTQIAAADQSNQSRIRIEASNVYARAAIKKALDDMEAATNGVCDHCGQDLPGHMREKHAEEMLGHAKRWEAKIQPVADEIPVAPLRERLDQAMRAYAEEKARLDAEPARIRSMITSVEAVMSADRSELRALEAKYAQNMAAYKRDFDSKVQEINSTVTNLETLVSLRQSFLTRAESSLADATKQAADADEQISQNKIKLQTLFVQLDQTLDLLDVFKGFRQVCFEDLIARISDRAGQLLSLMTDGVYSTRIDQMGESAKGEAKLILKPMITKGGQDVPVDDLSGGARRTVMLAYDVAVAEAVGDSNVLFLDEALDGLDTMGKGEALRLLEEVARTKAVLVIDHSSEIKAAFSNVIKITYKDGSSSLSHG